MRIVILWGCVLLYAAISRLSLLPQPKQVEEVGAALRLGDPVAVYISPTAARDEDAFFAARELAEVLEGAGLKTQLKVSLPPRSGGWLAVGFPDRDPAFGTLAAGRGLKLTEEMAAEGYGLSVTADGVVIAAASPAGVFYGVQTFRQLLRRVGGRAEVPGVRIHDWPTMRLRGIMHDTSRCQVPTVETGRRFIDFCAQYKLNFYGPYIEHTFAWEGHEEIWRGSGAWSPQEYVELCKYARPRHVIIIPQFEAMGHQYNILTKDRYRHMAETDGWSFAPAVDDTYVLLDDLLGQMSRAFPFHPFLGIGCDEVYDLGAGKSRELMEKLGGKGQLFAYHIQRLTEILARHGRRPMMWGDMMLNHPETMGLVPREVIVLDWHYGDAPEYPSVKRFRDAGYQVVVCPALSSWVRIFPDYFNAFGNIQHLYAEGQRNGALGGMTCNWGDWGAENFCAYNWFGWAWAAACSWGEAASQDREAFGRDFCATFYGTTATDLAEAHWQLARGNSIFPWGTHPIGYFHADPFTSTHPPAKRTRKLAEAVEKARRFLEQGAKRAARNADVIPYLAHAAARYEYVVRRCTDVARAADLYTSAFEATQPAVRRAKLAQCEEVLKGLRDNLAALRDDFRRLWLEENRPEGLEFDLAKFQAGLDSYEARLAAVRKALEGGELAAPEALGLQRRAGRLGLAVSRADLPLPEKWWDERWPYRAALRLEAGAADRPAGLPVILALDLANLCGEAVGPGSPRLVVDGEAYAAQLLPLCTPDGDFAPGAVAFLLPQAIPKGEALDAVLYWAPVGAPVPAAETDLAVEEGEGQVWVENGRLRVMLGTEGAHIFVWQVKALGGQDITEPGETDWAGFLDYNWCRRSPFAVKVLARGPVVAAVHCEDAEGIEKLVLVWAGLPLVDMTGDSSSWFWNYDAVSNFAADSATPGMGRFEDGTEAPIPSSGETIHLEPGRPTWWCAKYRDDGLTLGLITPHTPTGMMIGPGGGWGGVGMDHSPNPTDRFVTYCDVTAEKWQAVALLSEAMRADRPMRVLVGRPARLR
ncbi:MAG: beta-N-acetylhexosaminidase [Armatimonadetes bacterium]|nr:beta-N-acetylhexosaminidase [Armatimonadota bacterium]